MVAVERSQGDRRVVGDGTQDDPTPRDLTVESAAVMRRYGANESVSEGGDRFPGLRMGGGDRGVGFALTVRARR